MDELYKRIKCRREELGLTQEELAKKMGYKSRSSINKIEMGENDISQSRIASFAEALETTSAYLMGWRDEPDAYPQNLQPLPPSQKIPLLETTICQMPISAPENINDYLNLPNAIRADFCLQCQGDSMSNARIFDGDLVFISKQSEVEQGEIAAALIGNEAILKRVYRYPDKLILQPENPMYEPLVYIKEEMDEVSIIGKAVYFMSAVK